MANERGKRMKNMRILGDNIAHLLKGKNETNFAKALEFYPIEVARLKEGRLLLHTRDIEEIAEYLGTTREFLFTKHPEYSQVHIEGSCAPEDEDKILDLFDMYCDVVEAVR